MNKLTAKQLQMFNRNITGSEADCTAASMDVLDSIAAIPYEQNKELFYIYKDTIEKAAILGCSIQKEKPFRDGNSETAVLAMLTLLDVNGFELTGEKADLAALIGSLESYELVCRWLKEHSVNKR